MGCDDGQLTIFEGLGFDDYDVKKLNDNSISNPLNKRLDAWDIDDKNSFFLL